MKFEKTMCDRLGYKYKYVFENVLFAIHHLPYAKEYINEETLKLLEELNLKVQTGDIEIIEFTRPVYEYLDVDEIVKENKELKEKLEYLESKGE